MSGIIVQTGAADTLAVMTGQEQTSNRLVCKLFTNNHTPAASDTPASYTLPTDASYADVTLAYGTFVITTTTNGAQAVYNGVVFTFVATATIYGYIITDIAGTRLQTAEKFSSSILIPSTGGTLTVNITIPLETC